MGSWYRLRGPFGALATLAMAVSFASLTATGQEGAGNGSTPPNDGRRWVAPRTSWGHPDLQGIWDTASGIPFERPKELGTKAVLSAAEIAAQRDQAEKRRRELEKTNADVRQSKTDASTLTPTQLAGIIGPSVDFNPGLPDNRDASLARRSSWTPRTAVSRH